WCSAPVTGHGVTPMVLPTSDETAIDEPMLPPYKGALNLDAGVRTGHDAERWERIKQLFQAALDRPSADRSEFLRDACGGDLDLLAEMELLLEAHATAGSFAAQPAINVLGRSEHSENASAAPGSVAPLSSFAAGERLGPYRVCRGSDRAGWAMSIGR